MGKNSFMSQSWDFLKFCCRVVLKLRPCWCCSAMKAGLLVESRRLPLRVLNAEAADCLVRKALALTAREQFIGSA